MSEFVSDLSARDEKAEAIANRENFEKSINTNLWGYSEAGLEAKKAAMSMLATKNGMYARIPLVCKADACPYAETCPMLPFNLAKLGEPCVVETSQIEIRYAAYEKDFNLYDASFTDRNLVSELINHDIMLERCKALITKEGVLVVDVVAGISEDGEKFYRPEVSKHWEAYERIQKKRNDIYNLMLATRKDKVSVGQEESESTSQMMAEVLNADYYVEEKPENIE